LMLVSQIIYFIADVDNNTEQG